MNESTEGKHDEPHPADDPEPTMQCEYVFDRDSARWRAIKTPRSTNEEAPRDR